MKILNFGSCNIDYVYSLDHIVENGETESTQRLEVFCGGKGLNQSIAMKRAGADVCHAGCIGEGGGFLVDFLKENGVDVSLLSYVDEKNGHAIIQVAKNGDNSIFLYPGSNTMLTREYIDSVLEFFSKDDILILQNEINELAYIVNKAYDIGMKIILNPSPYNEIIEEIDLTKLFFLIMNEIEAKELSQSPSLVDALSFFAERYSQLGVVITLGKRGCVYQDAHTQLICPTFEVEAVDSTAAGDTFTGYFAVGIAQGMTVKDALENASCAAAVSVTRSGAAPSIPFAHEVEKQKKVMNKKGTDSIADQFLLEKINAYLEKHLTDGALVGLAEHLGYSAVYSSVLIKRLTGSTYKEFLQKRRLMRAAALLLQTQHSVGEIIQLVGYENESYFRSIFKKQYGQNPLYYRKTGGKII